MTDGFRVVALPSGVEGTMCLHRMPGRGESLEDVWRQLRAHRIDLIVCLAALDELRVKSPSYAAALETETVPCPVRSFPIADFGVPDDREAFWSLAADIATRLQAGGRILIHCGAGIGRTGTLATAVLLALGTAHADAAQLVKDSRSHAETTAQQELLAWCATRARRE